jgi:LDH2 family malate/lactate/ureidoglycolate dehydrogenase
VKTTENEMAGNTSVISPDKLYEVVLAALTVNGAASDKAEIQAANLLEGELRGHASHGIRRLGVLIERMRKGLIDPNAEPDLKWIAPAVLRVDGKTGFGPVVAQRAIDEAVARADETGVALAAISNSSHIGMLSPYVEGIAKRGQVALLLTTSEALVHAWGGRKATVGTNPIGIGVPSEEEPLVLDMSTASVSMGKVIDYAATGRALPDGWAVDAFGRPTTDGRAAVDGGAISPFGGPKGYALGIALEALVGVLTATAFGTGVVGTLDTELPATKGDLLVCVSLERLGLLGMLPLLEQYFEEVRRTGVAAPVDIPGDRARRAREAHLDNGIRVDPEVWTRALAYAEGTLAHD